MGTGSFDEDGPEGAKWREFGLRRALAGMPADSPGRAVVEGLLARGPKPETTSPPNAGGQLLEQLERLAALRERGLLTDTEFEEAKHKLLG